MSQNQNNPFIEAFKSFSEQLNTFNAAGKAVDTSAFFDAQRRTAEAVADANQVLTQGAHAVARRQAEIFQANASETIQLVRDLFSATSPETSVQTQADFVQSSFGGALANLRELTEIVSKSNIEAFDLLGKRIAESVGECASAVKTNTAAASAPAKKKAAA